MTEQLMEPATLGGGCFWCLEPVFRAVEGVEDAVVGYAGGDMVEPSYRQVTTGTTGHAEVVQVTFDPNVISYRGILEIFFSIHDPTTLNRQGADVGPQYRSIVLFHSEDQRQTAENLIRALDEQGIWNASIVTQIEPFKAFYRAEEYHQRYFEKNPYQGYCRAVVAPKLAKFRKQFASKLKEGVAAD